MRKAGRPNRIRTPLPRAWGVGPRAAQFLLDKNVQVLVTARIGGNALGALKAGGITILLYDQAGSTVRDAIAAYKSGGLKEQ